MIKRLGRIVGGAQQRLRARPWTALYLGLALAALAATHGSQGGVYVGDNRFEQYWNPARRIARSFAAWDGTRGLGRVREDFWPGVTAPIAVLRAVGLSPAAAEHLFHAMLLTAVGIGVVALLRSYRPTFGLEHVVAGLLATFGPYSATFLIPSNLYSSYALSPWLALAVVKGLRAGPGEGGNRERWRWASVFALLVFLAGNTDPPGLLYALVPAVVLGFGTIVRAQSARPRAMAWLVRVVPLTAATALVALTKVALASASFSQRLADTERPEVTSLASSFSESWRGLGLWVAYFRDSGGAARPQSGVLIASTPIVVATFAVPVLALAGLAVSRWSARWAFAAAGAVSLVLLTGAYPTEEPTRFGVSLLWVYDNVPLSAAFRSGYKAGAGLAVAVAVLAGVGMADIWRRSRPPLRAPMGAGLVLILIGVAVPFWSGGLYDDTRTLDDIPEYWDEAVAWLDEQPGDGRVLILPGTTRTRYRWGWVGDDIFDAQLRRAHAIDTSIPLSNPRSTDLLRSLTAASADPTQRDGVVADIARRLGIQYVVIRNDVDWMDQNTPRPARYDGLREDPTLEAVASFGQPGEFTTAAGDESDDAAEEALLPPVEILEVPDVVGGPAVRGMAPPLLVSGAGDAWSRLSTAGMLDDSGVVLYTADASDAELAEAVESGSPIVLTDTNRRHLDVVTGFRVDESHLLAPGEEIDDRPTQSLFEDPRTETVAHFGDAESVSATEAARSQAGFAPQNRPAQAFDGDPGTAWLTTPFKKATDQSLTVQLREATELTEVTVQDGRGEDSRRAVRRVDVRLDDDESIPLFLDEDGMGTLDLLGAQASSIELAIGEPVGSTPGLAEVDVVGLELTEFVQLPDDVWATLDDDRIAASAPLVIDVERERPVDGDEVESALRRRFRTAGERVLDVEAAAVVTTDTSDGDIDALLGGTSPAVASSRFQGDLAGQGSFAVDGDPESAWLAPPVSGESLTVRTAPSDGSNVEVRFDTGPDGVVPAVVRAESAGRTTAARVVDGAAMLDLGAPVGDELELTLERVPSQAAEGDDEREHPVRLTEVLIDGTTPQPSIENQVGSCRTGRLSIDDDDVALRTETTNDDIVDGGTINFTGCERLRLPSGWHRLESTAPGVLDGVRLSTLDQVPRRAVDPESTLERVTAADREIDVDGTGPYVLLSGESYDERWAARVDGTDLGPPRTFDTQSGWIVDEPPNGTTVELSVTAQRVLDGATLVTLVGVLVACWFIWTSRTRVRP